MSEYEQIRKMCLKRGELWEDPDFPANQASVFYHQTPPFQFTWKRPKDLCPRPGFIQDGPTKFDISPGKMGDRWLVSCLGVLHLNRGLFYRVVPADQSFVGDQYCGLFRFRIWWCGEWSEVLVDDRLPTVHGRLAFLQSQNSDYYWPGLLEKAYANVNTCSNEFVDLIILRNPMEDGEYTGPFAPDTIEWSDIPAVEATRIESCLQEQDFWMPSSEFLQTFTHLELVHLDSDTSRDEPSLNGKSSWQMRLYQGMWRRGVTAGGCRNNPDTFHVNPQLHLFLSEMEETVMSLNQHSVMEPKVIGFSAYTMPKMGTDTIGRVFFKKNKSLFNSQYTNSRQVSHRSQLEQGGYLIVPTTFEPGQESGFTLRVFSRKPLKLKLIDSVPMLLKPAVVTAPLLLDGKSFSQYEAVFLQLADEHRSVNAFELQELLDACLPNDYIKSCASLEVCRQIVFAFEQNGCTGRLKFSDFKDLMCSLKNWQTAFKNQTKEKTGILKAERFRDALLEVGFQMSSDVLTTLILRYMRKDGTLRFGDFVSAILHLSVAFHAFESKDPSQSGTIRLSLSEWLKSSLSC
ncbi:calpain-C isoform X3 [Dendroctonus ponderosae]|uniref:calpain-C isoform X3 n=1 Tax=Dendroctonus ponderosae TaxID=77166 RepID=UPI002035C0E4|nr:calpain-C isoform X3 [Dendroctonus ponderosae]